MLQLSNNCRCGKISVFPKNWKTSKADPQLIWYIFYRFYDDNSKKSKKIIIKGMNSFSKLKEKKEATQLLLQDEISLLQQGYNKITCDFYKQKDYEVTEYTPFIEALSYSYDKLKISTNAKIDIKSCLKYLRQAAILLGYEKRCIKDIKRKQLIILLEKTGELKKSIRNDAWTANTFNYYRTSLSILYKYLVRIEVVDVNPVLGIEKERKVKKIRQTLSLSERKTINDFLSITDPVFWRFMQIFFHSGCRITELLAVRKIDVELENQRFKVTVKKGAKYQEEWRTIKTVAVNFWKQVLDLAQPSNILFSLGLLPGENTIRREQVTRRWRRHIKHKLGITSDFYSLKHINLDEIAELLSIKDAQAMAGHTTPVITMTYTVGEKQRKHERLKEIGNEF